MFNNLTKNLQQAASNVNKKATEVATNVTNDINKKSDSAKRNMQSGSMESFLYENLEEASPQSEDKVRPTFIWFDKGARPCGARGEKLVYEDYKKEGFPSIIGRLQRFYKSSDKVIFIVHGYLMSEKVVWMSKMKDALLANGDHTVLLIGWSDGSAKIDYRHAAANVAVVGNLIGEFAEAFYSSGVPREKLHCIGHSLGSHISGFAGKRFKLGRISALDPAGPIFNKYPDDPTKRLDTTDANFVDVIHTDCKTNLPKIVFCFGTFMRLGHVDFYPNKGYEQPGWNPALVAYSHHRAIEFYTESIRNPDYYKQRKVIKSDPIMLPEGTFEESQFVQQMGYFSDKWPLKDGMFYSVHPETAFRDIIEDSVSTIGSLFTVATFKAQTHIQHKIRAASGKRRNGNEPSMSYSKSDDASEMQKP